MHCAIAAALGGHSQAMLTWFCPSFKTYLPLLILVKEFLYRYKGKCFTYVTKTIANSTTYSRKPGDCNGTIIFEFDIMKNSSTLNLKFTFFTTVKTKITLLFCWTHSPLNSASKCDRVNQNQRNNQKICEKVKYDQDLNSLGTSFSWYQSQK